MGREEKEDFLGMVKYFWTEKRDFERWVDWDIEKAKEYCPEMLKAWEDFKISEKILNAVINQY